MEPHANDAGVDDESSGRQAGEEYQQRHFTQPSEAATWRGHRLSDLATIRDVATDT